MDFKTLSKTFLRIVNRFVGILKSKIKDLDKGLTKLIRQILLHWCYELTLS